MKHYILVDDSRRYEARKRYGYGSDIYTSVGDLLDALGDNNRSIFREDVIIILYGPEVQGCAWVASSYPQDVRQVVYDVSKPSYSHPIVIERHEPIVLERRVYRDDDDFEVGAAVGALTTLAAWGLSELFSSPTSSTKKRR